MKRFFNKPIKVVTEAIDGELRLTGDQNLTRANGFPATKFVVRGDWDKSKVAVVSGGGSGHEPAHVGFVGKGMLTAAISGEVFASPSVEAILACILHVTGEAGCLLIVKNYTGDRLNFGLAAEKAKKMGKKVEMVVVKDDIAIANARQPRGIAGTLFVHKIAGYLSEQGALLEEIKQKAEDTATNIMSLGLAISTCTLPDKEIDNLQRDAELGLGIHGEPGLETIEFKEGKEAVAIVLSRLFAGVDSNYNYALMINNLGTVTPLEMSIIANEVLISRYQSQIKYVIGPALLMTSLNMYGFSLSLLKLTDENEKMLNASVGPSAWPGVVSPKEPEIFSIDYLQLKSTFETSENPKVQNYIQTICTALLNAEAHLNNLDKKIGDGDTGSTFASGAAGIIDMLNSKKLPLNETDNLLIAIGESLARHMGGSSGVLSSIMFTNAGMSMSNGASFADAMHSGVKTMMKYGGASLGSRTMIDALMPAVEKLKENNLEAAALAARGGANLTAKMTKAESGRSSYLRSESLKDVVDPGAEAIAIIFESIASKSK